MYVVKEKRKNGTLWVHLDTADKAGVLKVKKGAVSDSIYSFEIQLSFEEARRFCGKLMTLDRDAEVLKIFSNEVIVEAGEFVFTIKNK